MTSMKITGLALAGAALIGAVAGPAMASSETRSGASLPRQARTTHVAAQGAKAPALALAQRAPRPDRRDRLREHLERRWHNFPGGACGRFKFHFCNDSPG